MTSKFGYLWMGQEGKGVENRRCRGGRGSGY